MRCDSLDGSGAWVEWIHVYVWVSPFTVLKLSQHCLLINCTYIKLKVKGKKKKKTMFPLQQAQVRSLVDVQDRTCLLGMAKKYTHTHTHLKLLFERHF